jgi:predicted small lipoprotein YifL
MRYHDDFMRFLLLGVAVALLATACGQRGALYLRDNPPAGVKPERTDRYKPVPYPRESSEQK